MMISIGQGYNILLIFFVISGVLSGILLILSYFLSYKGKISSEKLSAYECGFEPFGEGQGALDIHFYIIGILFVIFDLEIVFLFPLCVCLNGVGPAGGVIAIIFVTILTVGFIYEWLKGALDW